VHIESVSELLSTVKLKEIEAPAAQLFLINAIRRTISKRSQEESILTQRSVDCLTDILSSDKVRSSALNLLFQVR